MDSIFSNFIKIDKKPDPPQTIETSTVDSKLNQDEEIKN
jgi:hypothetical protein